VFREREMPEEPEVHEVHFGQVTDSDGRTNLARLLARLGVVPSRSEAKRLIGQGAVEIDGKVTTTDVVELTDGMVLRVGKRRFLRIVDADKQSQS
jgi:tyrosyl-tRNA synthetase